MLPATASMNSAKPAPASEASGLAVARFASLNDLVLGLVQVMPKGGGYSTGATAFASLRRAIQLDPKGAVLLQPDTAKPAFCSGATYLVFLSVISHLHREGRLPISDALANSLLVKMQPDGVGVWGRWNANGPGTARLFHELQLGRNFTSFDEAQPGDFLKIWWNSNIGSTEKGHSVIYMGSSIGTNGEPTIAFWSANSPDGFGIKSVPKSQIKRALFSRLENPRAIERALTLQPRDNYLAEMLKRPTSEAEMCKMLDIPFRPSSRPPQDGTGAHGVPSSIPGIPTSVTSVPADVPPPTVRRGDGGTLRPEERSAEDAKSKGSAPKHGTKPKDDADKPSTPPNEEKKSFLKRLFGG